MTAPRVAPAYIAGLIAAGKITVKATTAGRPPNPVRTKRLDKERERQRLKRVALAAKGLTCLGTKRKRKVYELRVGMSAAELAEVKWLDRFKHMLKTLGYQEMMFRADWHERLAYRLERVLAGEHDGSKAGLTYRRTKRKRRANRPLARMSEEDKKEAHRVAIELHNLARRGREDMERRVKWHRYLAAKMVRFTMVERSRK